MMLAARAVVTSHVQEKRSRWSFTPMHLIIVMGFLVPFLYMTFRRAITRNCRRPRCFPEPFTVQCFVMCLRASLVSVEREHTFVSVNVH